MKRFEDMTLNELMDLLEEGTVYGDYLSMLVELRSTNSPLQVNKMFESLTSLLTQEAKESFNRIVTVERARLNNQMPVFAPEVAFKMNLRGMLIGLLLGMIMSAILFVGIQSLVWGWGNDAPDWYLIPVVLVSMPLGTIGALIGEDYL